jgi:hypothetical protein
MFDELDLLTLNAPAGNGQINDPADIAALDDSLRRINAYAPPLEYANEPQRYATEPMINALEKFQEQNGLKIDGYAAPGGPTERAINNRLLGKPRGAGLLYDSPAPLSASVGDGRENRRADVATVQRLLGALDHMPEDPFDAPHGFVDQRTLDGVKGFQRRKGLREDGWLAPGGETERALHAAGADLARLKRKDWLKFFAERAAQAQAHLSNTLESRPLAFGHYTNSFDPRLDDGPIAESEGKIIQVQSRGALGRGSVSMPPWIGIDPETQEITPGSPADVLRRIFESAGRYPHSPVRMGEVQRQELPDREQSGSRTILLPPVVPNEPNRGPDPSNPPLHPKDASPPPFPSRAPHVSNKAENIPPRIDPREYIIVLPDLSDWISRFPIIVKNRIGDPPVQDLNRELGSPVVEVGKKVLAKAASDTLAALCLIHPAAERKNGLNPFVIKKSSGSNPTTVDPSRMSLTLFPTTE